MIKLQDYTPEVYYKKSRDFQFIGRLYDIVLNYVKTNTELIYNLPISQDSDSQLLDLMAMTMGFQSKHTYNTAQLKAVCSILPTILRKKGSLSAIELIGNAVCRAEGITTAFTCYIDNNDSYNIVMSLPSELSDTSLFRDLLNYVVPAGMTYELIAETTQTQTTTSASSVDNITAYNVNEKEVSVVLKASDLTNASYATNTPVKDTPGFIANSTVVGIPLIYSPNEEDPTVNKNILYNGTATAATAEKDKETSIPAESKGDTTNE